MRINLVNPVELSDQHLIAEYMEIGILLDNINKGKYKLRDIPEFFVLGKGHVKFFINKPYFLRGRNFILWLEMKSRGFKPSKGLDLEFKDWNCNEYIPSERDIEISRARIIESYNKKPEYYRWTLREKPSYLSS
jgi:deoxyribonuclease (pyrimidine dimer)